MSAIDKQFADRLIHLYGRVRKGIPGAPGNPLGYFFYLTCRCNLRCDYCWQRKDELRKPNWLNSCADEMAPEQWTEAVRRLPKPSFLCLSGGEASLSPSFVPVLEEAARRNIPVTVNTNGRLLQGDPLEAVIACGVKNVSVSLDGFAAHHDACRKSEGLFDRIVSGIHRLNRFRRMGRGPSLTIKTVLLDDNLDAMRRFRKFCGQTLKAQCLNISLAKNGDHAQVSLKYCTDMFEILSGSAVELHPYADKKRVERVLSALLSGNARHTCKVSLYPQMGDGARIARVLSSGARGGFKPCTLPWAAVTVLPDGQVIPCLSVALGNIRDHDCSVRQVLAQGPYTDFLTKVASFGGEPPPCCSACCFLRTSPSI